MKLIKISIVFISLCILVLICNNAVDHIVYKKRVEAEHQLSIDSLPSVQQIVQSMTDAIEIENRCYNDSFRLSNLSHTKVLFYKKKCQIASEALNKYKVEIDSIKFKIDSEQKSYIEEVYRILF